jgi:hypothetical protein
MSMSIGSLFSYQHASIGSLFSTRLWVQRPLRQEAALMLPGIDAYASGGKLHLVFEARRVPIGGHPVRFDMYYGRSDMGTSYKVDCPDFKKGATVTLDVAIVAFVALGASA